MIKLATAAMQCVYNKQANLEKMLRMVDEAAGEGADFIVFPEQALSGYLVELHRIHTKVEDDFDEYWYQYENAECVPEGPSVQTMIKKAQEKNIYISFGMTRKEQGLEQKIYNSVVLVGPDGYVGKYDKVHLPIDEAHMFFRGREFPVFETRLGKIGFNICCDVNYPEAAREVTLQGADILVYAFAWALDKDDPDPAKDNEYILYDHFVSTRQLENQCYVITSNQFGKNGTCDFFGHGDIITPDGRHVANTGFAEGIAYYETNSIKDDLYRGIYSYFGLHLLKNREPSAYKNQMNSITTNDEYEQHT